jgi:superfamily I DNA and/or RNA helicase
LVRSALNDGLLDIGVITPYVEQARLTRDLLRREKLLGESIECSTVHRFQGREKNMIILDLVDTAPLPPGKLLADQSTTSDAARLLNVSLSRARGKLLVVADCAYFLKKIPQSTLSLFLHEARQVGLVATRENIPDHLP